MKRGNSTKVKVSIATLRKVWKAGRAGKPVRVKIIKRVS